MSSTVIMPMPMRLTGSVAPTARVRVPWQTAPMSAGLGLGLGSSFVCITKLGNQDHVTEINHKAYGRWLPENSIE